jgi:cold shock CspA family protein
MGRSQESFGKREKEKLRQKKREEKDKKKADRKANPGGGMDDMIAYVDEFGMISSTPPDPTKKKTVINAEDIEIGIPKKSEEDEVESTLKGVVTFFDTSKGFGFIKVAGSADSVFVHVKSCLEPIGENDKVEFTTERGPKGLSAVDVKKQKA